MTKRELVIEVAARLRMTQNEVGGIVHETLDAITHSLAEGHRLEIRNFGVFEVKERGNEAQQEAIEGIGSPRTARQYVPRIHERLASI